MLFKIMSCHSVVCYVAQQVMSCHVVHNNMVCPVCVMSADEEDGYNSMTLLLMFRSYMWGSLDDLMYEIPGKDNYGAFLIDESLGLEYHIHSTTDSMQKLNTAYYHR